MASNRYWLQLPDVSAPGPYDKSKTVNYAVSETYIRTLLAGNRLTQIYWAWAHIAGELPPCCYAVLNHAGAQYRVLPGREAAVR